MSAPRYALYLAPPPDSPLWAFGCRWLGRDAAGGTAIAQPAVAGLAPERLHALTEDPRRYGFHATLKPPFALRAGTDEAGLRAALAAFARRQPHFLLPALRLTDLDGFLALTPSGPCPAVHDLADACVRAFDAFRQPPDEAELARRRKARLSARQDEYLQRWGYPYVFEEFRFHMTLSQRLAAEDKALLWPAIAADAAARLERGPVPVNELCLFAQASRIAPFAIAARFTLGA
ncbi:MAG: DUF1045 domain-containing protein [Alphaproteobacteria bacterium]|nr:DUF1045 domain-containing protein [Alphaproteobacteria bacterium]